MRRERLREYPLACTLAFLRIHGLHGLHDFDRSASRKHSVEANLVALTFITKELLRVCYEIADRLFETLSAKRLHLRTYRFTELRRQVKRRGVLTY